MVMFVSVVISRGAIQLTPLPHLPDRCHSSGEFTPHLTAPPWTSLSVTLLLFAVRVVRNMGEQSVVQVHTCLLCHMNIT